MARISEKMNQAINEQINAELYSGYLYLAMAAYFESEGWRGMAKWMHLQAGEEQAHAMKFFAFLYDRGGRVTLQAIDQPPAKWDSPLAAFREAYGHEQKVSARIYKLLEQAQAEKDHATAAMLKWFVDEQVEEEANADQIVQQLEMIGEAKGALFMLDHQLGKRGQ